MRKKITYLLKKVRGWEPRDGTTMTSQHRGRLRDGSLKSMGMSGKPSHLGSCGGKGNGLVTELTGEHCPPQKFWGWGRGLGLNMEGERILKGLAGDCPHGPARTDTSPPPAPCLGCPPTPGSGCLIQGSAYGALNIHGTGEAERKLLGAGGGGGSAILIEGRVPPQLSTTPKAECSGSQECQDWEPLVTATPDSPLPMLFSLQKKYLASLLHLGSYTSSKPSSKSTSSVKPSLNTPWG